VDPRLIILGLVKKAPMHGYEIQRVMKESRADQWAGLLKGSIYHALKQMAAEGWLKVRTSTGRAKAVYEITGAGRMAFKQLLQTAWRAPARGFPANLFTAVAFLEGLPAREVLALLGRQQEQLSAELQRWREGERPREPQAPHLRLLFDSACQHLEVDLRLTESLRLLLGAYAPRQAKKGQV
jgi:DNA-binding PadR family transcriptional regulator